MEICGNLISVAIPVFVTIRVSKDPSLPTHTASHIVVQTILGEKSVYFENTVPGARRPESPDYSKVPPPRTDVLSKILKPSRRSFGGEF